MESLHWFACLLTAALLLVSTFFRRRRHLALPPGPKPWPIIGNLNLIGPLPHRSINQLTLKYGPIMQLRFGSIPVVVGSSVEMAKVFLKTMDATFANRPKLSSGKYTTYNYSDILWSPYGTYWRQMRKICLMELFSTRRLDSYEFIRVEELNSMLINMFNSAGSIIKVKDYLTTFNLNIITRMVLGKRYLDKDDNSVISSEEFKKTLNELFLLNGELTIGDSIPWLRFFDLGGHIKRMKECTKEIDKFLDYIIDEHIASRSNEKDNCVANDMVDVLLEVANDPTLEVKLERNCIKAVILDLLGAGTESSSIVVEWAMSAMLKNSKTLIKAQEELDCVIGPNRWVQEDDLINLPYIDAILKESMRMYPVTPMIVPRESREDCKVDGYDIPKGTRVLVNMWSIGRDPTVWDEPQQFNPDRFIGKTIDVKGNDFELLPFGAGRRMCPAYNLGLKMVKSSLANLLHGFKWSLPNGMDPEDLNMDEIFGLSTIMKNPLMAVVEPRLPLNLYHTISNK
ncbi:trimethyltridecatetraene synthase-like [Impatiens glandulifera]|uniref:trimethyltridecatetraene synthase-like n=1 Tax=Impatiens glandulifera TaxID=253017 RepID=UPI001FB0FBD4|nr:trimethyltridecatetraene synthase-like [Impatiens glandulifera]